MKLSKSAKEEMDSEDLQPVRPTSFSPSSPFPFLTITILHLAVHRPGFLLKQEKDSREAILDEEDDRRSREEVELQDGKDRFLERDGR